MQFQTFIEKLTYRLQQPLPGEAAQFRMAPERRITMAEYVASEQVNPRLSAVLICLFPDNENICTWLMLRPDEQGAHSGQVSFPGGRFESGDIDLQTTALREAHEEIGIDRAKIEVIGTLTDLYIPVSNNLVRPFIGFVKEKPALQKNDVEVKAIIETDISLILNPALKQVATFTGLHNRSIRAPYYNIHGHKVWGATAMMLSELESIILQQEPV